MSKSNNSDSNNDDSNANNTNPFSFKKFITKQTEPSPPIVTNLFSSNNQNINILNEEDDTLINNGKKSKNTSNSNNNNSNPFSFRQFLNETTSNRIVNNDRKSSLRNDEENEEEDEEDDSNNDDDIILPNFNIKQSIPIILPSISPPPLNFDDKTSPYILPDFINESIGEKSTIVNKNIEDPYLVLENISPTLPPVIPSKSYFDLESKLPFNNSNELKLRNDKSSIDVEIPGYFDLESSLASNDFNDYKSSNNQKGLNKTYLKQLAEKQSIIEEQQIKLEQYHKQLDVLKRKEDQETKTLEDIILNIEKNLKLQTTRAIDAENLVEKLRVENKSLKCQIQNLSSENELLKLNSNNSSSMKQVINSYAEQLNHAAVSGESIIKQLLSGVDTLKFLSQNLENIGKIQEINNDSK